MTITLLLVGRTDMDFVKSGMQVYEKRLQHYGRFETLVIPELKGTKGFNTEQFKQKEGEQILAKLEPTDFVVLLDEKGKNHNSRQFAAWLNQRMSRGIKRLVFVVGGAYGFSPAVYERANGKLSLSAMTFSHQIIRVIFLEQLYRAFTILNNQPYHND